MAFDENSVWNRPTLLSQPESRRGRTAGAGRGIQKPVSSPQRDKQQQEKEKISNSVGDTAHAADEAERRRWAELYQVPKVHKASQKLKQDEGSVVGQIDQTPTDLFAMMKTERTALSSLDAMMSRVRASSFLLGSQQQRNKPSDPTSSEKQQERWKKEDHGQKEEKESTKATIGSRRSLEEEKEENFSGRITGGIAELLSAQQLDVARQHMSTLRNKQKTSAAGVGGIKHENAEVLEDFREWQKTASNMEKWLAYTAEDEPTYTYEMSKVGGNDHWRKGDPPPYQRTVKLRTSERERGKEEEAATNRRNYAVDQNWRRETATFVSPSSSSAAKGGPINCGPINNQKDVLTVTTTGSSFDALFSYTAEAKFRKQLEGEEEHFPHYAAMREWITKRMIPLEERHSLTSDAANINNLMRAQWSRHCIAPAPVSPQPLYNIPNTYPDSHISPLPIAPSPTPHPRRHEGEKLGGGNEEEKVERSRAVHHAFEGRGGAAAEHDDFFATFVDNKRFEEGDVTLLDADNRRSNVTGEMLKEFKLNDEFMPWLKSQHVAPFNSEISSDPNYVPPVALDALYSPGVRDPLEGFPFAERLARSRRMKKEGKVKSAEPKWIRWDEEEF